MGRSESMLYSLKRGPRISKSSYLPIRGYRRSVAGSEASIRTQDLQMELAKRRWRRTVGEGRGRYAVSASASHRYATRARPRRREGGWRAHGAGVRGDVPTFGRDRMDRGLHGRPLASRGQRGRCPLRQRPTRTKTRPASCPGLSRIQTDLQGVLLRA